MRGSRKGGRRAHNPETRIVTGDRNQIGDAVKTNHQRGFVEQVTAYVGKGSNGPGAFKYFSAKSQIGDTIITVGARANTHDTTNGKHGIAHNILGAKKFVRSRIRIREKAALREIASAGLGDNENV